MLALMFSLTELAELRKLVRDAAMHELMGRFRAVEASTKHDGSVITEADLAMQRRLQGELDGRWPAFALLGEEMSDAAHRQLLQSQDTGLWCLDPLDGTSNFAAGIPYFGVSLALISDGAVQVGVVFDPVRDECFSALRGVGAWLDGESLQTPAKPVALGDAMGMVDLKRLPPEVVRALAARAPYRSQRSFGSVALDWCWLASGRCQVYLHGGQKLWDYAAGQLILQESGGAGGLLDAYRGAWLSRLSLTPRIAVAASHHVLLGQWRAWIEAALDQD